MKPSTTPPSTFYVTGGTLPLDAPSYVERRADDKLFQALQGGELCYVLTSRQMGKSSLMVRAADRLRRNGAAVAVLDLTALGRNLTPAQWHDGLLLRLGEQLDLEDELEAFQEAHARLAPLQRAMRALRGVVLERIRAPVVVFLDEIDVVRSLPFSSDEFFAAIRALFNARAESPELRRLTFCLLGVATPSDLIRDARITPFNIGRRIELDDFTPAEAAPLGRGLHENEETARDLLQRVLYWSGGHPYLTQRLCRAIAADAAITRAEGVDRICEALFLSSRARETDNNLLFVRDRMLHSDVDHAALLNLYRQVRANKKVRDEETDPYINILRLAGLARVRDNHLRVRNRIYARVFDPSWIETNMPDAEKRRQKTAFRRGLLRMGIPAGVVIAGLVAGGWWYLDRYMWEHKAYYNTYAKRYGLPRGVGRLSAAQVRRRAVSLQFISEGRNNSAHTMMAVNPTGECTSRHGFGTYLKAADWKEQLNPMRECRWIFERGSNGQVVYEKAFNKEGRLVWGLVYSPDTAPDKARAHYVGPNGHPMPQKGATAEFVEFTYSPKGYETSIRYTDRKGESATGLDGAYGRRRKYDEHGLMIEDVSLGETGQPMIDEKGNAGLRVKYDALGNALEGVAFGTKFEPILSNDGWHKVTIRYDERGNRIEEAYFGTDGKPVLYKDGYHKWTIRYDERGNRIEEAYFGIAGQPVLRRDGVHKWTFHYDERGDQIEEAYFGATGQPVLRKDGVHKWTGRYDERGNRIEQAYFDTAGQPVLHKDGVHKWVARYDERGNRIEMAYFDTAGQPVLDKNGVHKWTARYDERGNLIEKAYFDTAGQPVSDKDGVHKWTARYDERDNLIEKAYFGAAGQPMLHKDGYHKVTTRYDERGNPIEVAYFDIAGQPVLNKDGVHKWALRYDEHGNLIEATRFDTDGNPI